MAHRKTFFNTSIDIVRAEHYLTCLDIDIEGMDSATLLYTANRLHDQYIVRVDNKRKKERLGGNA